MSFVRAMLCSLFVCLALHAGDERVMPNDVAASVQTWMQDNVDDWVFEVTGIDRTAVDQSLTLIQEELGSAMPTNAVPHREDAERMVRTLDRFEGTRPFALQLRSFLDEQEQPQQSTNVAKISPAPTTPQAMFEFWLSVMTNRPVPVKANDYLSRIKPIFQAEGVPAELAWLAEVESSFDPDAKSPVGAVGLFQLMPNTARSLGLSTWFPDERRNAEKNARAAARYLQQLHDRFGDWRLAIAAYNAGPTRVARLLRKSKVYGYDAIASQLPTETQEYVAKAEAILFVREGVDLTSLQLAKG